MNTIVGSVTGTLLGKYLPFDATTNMALAMASKDAVTIGLDKCGGAWTWLKSTVMGRNRCQIIVNANEMSRPNPIYIKLREFIVEQYVMNIRQCNIVPHQGEVTINFRDVSLKTPIAIVYDAHYLYVHFSDEEVTEYVNNVPRKASKSIIVYSDTATLGKIKEFVESTVKLERKQNTISVYRASRVKKDETPVWECLCFQSNKTIDNTILGKLTEEALFADVDLFMQSKELYARRGLDYKRGYMLYGPPGCGKSSSIKAIANKYRLPIFYLDLETVKNNSELISLMDDILYLVADSSWILTIEDFDRYECFTNKRAYDKRKEKVTLQCLLNVIDGIVEAHGRLLFITCNDHTELLKTDALVRPGRIDRMVEFTNCDGGQATRLINNFFQSNVIVDESRMRQMSPADLIKVMQTTQSVDATLAHVYEPSGKRKRDSKFARRVRNKKD